MNDQQRRLYGLLKEIHQICENHGIVYYLAGGTLIGAVRHGGFLPWDDDADLYMTRENWNKFVAACESDLPENRVLQAPDLDITYGNTFPRYVATDSTCIHSHQILGGTVVGEVIDIFILDPISDDAEVLNRYTYDLMLYSDLINYAGVFGRRFGVKAHDYLKFILLRRFKGERCVRDFFESRLASYLDNGGSRYVMRWGGNPLVFDKSWFSGFSKVRFEEDEFLAPSGINEYLVCHYGDEWATVPSHAERSSHDTASIPDVSCEEALEYYRQKTKSSVLAKELVLRKALLLAGANRDLRLQTEVIEAEAKLQTMELVRLLEKNKELLDASLLSGDFSALSMLFSGYLDWQTSKRVIGRDDWSGVYRYNNPVLADLDDEVFHLIVLVLLSTERIGKAARLLEVAKNKGRSSSDLDSDWSFVCNFRLAVNHFHYGRYDDALCAARSLLEKHPGNISLLKLEVVVLYKLSKISDNWTNRLIGAIGESLRLFPDDGFFGACKAFVDLEADVDDDAALLSLRRAVENTNNGFILRFAKEVYFVEPLGAASASGKELALEKEVCCAEEGDLRQARLFELLKELVSICEENEILYVLSPGAVYSLGCGKTMPSALDDFSICLDALNHQKLLRVLPSYTSCNRGYEYRGNSPHFVGDEIRYVSKDSLFINEKKIGASVCPGLYVSARLLSASKYSSFLTVLRNGWNATALYSKKPRSFKRLAQAIAIAFPSMFCRKRMGHYIYEKTIDESACIESGVVSFGGKKKYQYPVMLLSDSVFLEFEGMRFRIPRDFRRYMVPFLQKCKYSPDRLLSFPSNALVSSSVSFFEFDEAKPFSSSFCRRHLLSSFLNAYPRFVKGRFTEEFNRMKYAVGAKKATLDLSRDKELILAEFESGDFSSLRERFRSYVLLMGKYPLLKKFVFDDRLFKIALVVKVWGSASDEFGREAEFDRLLSVLGEGVYEAM